MSFSIKSWHLLSKENLGFKLVLAIAAVFFCLVSLLALNRHYSLFSEYDQGLFNQLFWNSVHGRFFQGSLTSGNSGAVLFEGQIPSVSYHHFGQHFVIDFVLWFPLYALLPSDATLILLQVGLIAAAGIVLYALARQYLQPPLAVMIAAGYYGAGATIAPTLANFYEACQIPLFVFGLLLALERQQWWWFGLMTLLTLGIREDAGIMLFGIGAYLLLSRRYPRLGAGLCCLSFVYVVVVTTKVMPLFSTDSSKLYLGTYFSKFVKTREPTTLEVLWGILTHPRELLQSLFTPLDRRLLYLSQQWLPLAFVPAISGAAWVMAIPPLIVILLQQKSRAVVIHLHYAWTLVPAIFYGAILWWSQHQERFKLRLRQFWLGCIVLSVLILVVTNVNLAFSFLIPDSISPWRFYTSLTRQWEHAGVTHALIDSIPVDASVAGTNYLIPHLSNRQEVVALPIVQIKNAQGAIVPIDYAIADLSTVQPRHKALRSKSRLRGIVETIDQLILQAKYGVVNLQDRVVLIQRGVASKPEALAAWATLRDEVIPRLQEKKK